MRVDVSHFELALDTGGARGGDRGCDHVLGMLCGINAKVGDPPVRRNRVSKLVSELSLSGMFNYFKFGAHGFVLTDRYASCSGVTSAAKTVKQLRSLHW